MNTATTNVESLPLNATSNEKEPQAQPAKAYPFDEQLGNNVTLSQDDPSFNEKKDWLKENGYRWNGEESNWELSQVDPLHSLHSVLSVIRNPRQKIGARVQLDNDKHFASNMQTLEKLGYQRNPERNCFELPEEPKKCPFKNSLGTSVSIANDDSKFVEKMEWLEANSYTRNALKNTWELEPAKIISLKRKAVGSKVINFTKSSVAVAFVVIGGAVGIFVDSM